MIYKEKINRYNPKVNCPALKREENYRLGELSESFPLPEEYISSFQRKQTIIRLVLSSLPLFCSICAILNFLLPCILLYLKISPLLIWVAYGIIAGACFLLLLYYIILVKLDRKKYFSTENYIFRYYKSLYKKLPAD